MNIFTKKILEITATEIERVRDRESIQIELKWSKYGNGVNVDCNVYGVIYTSKRNGY